MNASIERRCLQVAIAVAGLVPVGGGLLGILRGASMSGPLVAPPFLDSHMRYLSGLLLAIGLAFYAAVPSIERQGSRVRVLTALVFCGGLARLWGEIVSPDLSGQSLFALGMELAVTPMLCLWQARVARLYRSI